MIDKIEKISCIWFEIAGHLAENDVLRHMRLAFGPQIPHFNT